MTTQLSSLFFEHYKSVETITIQQWIFPSVESILVLKKNEKKPPTLFLIYIQHEQYCITHWYKWRKNMNHFYTRDERWNGQPFICTLAQIYTSKNSEKQQHELHRQSTLANLMFYIGLKWLRIYSDLNRSAHLKLCKILSKYIWIKFPKNYI